MDLDWDPPIPGMYNGRWAPGRTLRVSNGKRIYLVGLGGTEGLTERNISVFYENDTWVIKSGVGEQVHIETVTEVLEAHLQVYPQLVPTLKILTRD